MNNCAAGVSSMNVKRGANIYAGGLVGYADATIECCSAGISLLDVSTSSSAFSCAGGLVGYMSGSIHLSYATGWIADSTATTWTGGLTGYTAGMIANCYAAVRVPLDNKNRYGLAGWEPGKTNIIDSRWLAGTFSHCGRMYTMNGIGLNDPTLGIQASTVKVMNDNNQQIGYIPGWLTGMGLGTYTFTGEFPAGSEYANKCYPYPTGVTNAKWGWAAGHYGLWPILEHN